MVKGRVRKLQNCHIKLQTTVILRNSDHLDYPSNYLPSHDRATPFSRRRNCRSYRPPSQRCRLLPSIGVIVTSLLPFSTVLQPISVQNDGHDFRLAVMADREQICERTAPRTVRSQLVDINGRVSNDVHRSRDSRYYRSSTDRNFLVAPGQGRLEVTP